MNVKATIQEVYGAFENGNIDSLSKAKCVEYIQTLCCEPPKSTENAVTLLNKVHSLNTIYNVNIMKALSKSNTILTGVVIFLAICTLVLSIIQFICP